MNLELTGKAAIVTGGSRGIGKAIAMELAREGADVAIVARDEAVLAAAAEEIRRETGATVVASRADTGDDESVAAMVRAVAGELGRIDILVNCAAEPAGQGATPLAEEVRTDQLMRQMNVKVMGYLRCIRETLPHMRRHGFGRIISISGMGARKTDDRRHGRRTSLSGAAWWRRSRKHPRRSSHLSVTKRPAQVDSLGAARKTWWR